MSMAIMSQQRCAELGGTKILQSHSGILSQLLKKLMARARYDDVGMADGFSVRLCYEHLKFECSP